MDVFQTSGCVISYRTREAANQDGELSHRIQIPAFTIKKGDRLAIIGPSGSGKSTFSTLVLGETLDATITGEWTTNTGKCAWVGQDHFGNLNPRVTVARHLELAGAPRTEVPALLEKVQLPVEYSGRFPSQLSGGERARVALAICFAAKPSLLCIDELTSSFDTETTLEILRIIKSIAGELTVLFITHDHAAAHYLCDTVLSFSADGVAQYYPSWEAAHA
ncbi:MAG: ATP-binding cassette domain-containing protein [Corynebacterium sp.]|nr:ATP-binding cassette domain-containing protein [Corynebacterium sp.]